LKDVIDRLLPPDPVKTRGSVRHRGGEGDRICGITLRAGRAHRGATMPLFTRVEASPGHGEARGTDRHERIAIVWP
jgi:hypothetical protein